MKSSNDSNSPDIFLMRSIRSELEIFLGQYYRIKIEPSIPLVSADLYVIKTHNPSHMIRIELENPEIINMDLVERIQIWLSNKKLQICVALQIGTKSCESLILGSDELHFSESYKTLQECLSGISQQLHDHLEKLKRNRLKYSPNYNYGQHRPKLP